MSRRIPWTDAAVTTLRELHAQGLSSRVIGLRMGVSERAVSNQVWRLRLIRTSPVKAVPAPMPALVPVVPRTVPRIVPPAPIIQFLEPQPSQRVPRVCLACRRAFPSESRGNRVCPACKKNDAWKDGIFDHASDGARHVQARRA